MCIRTCGLNYPGLSLVHYMKLEYIKPAARFKGVQTIVSRLARFKAV